jgi:hypothetical protein
MVRGDIDAALDVVFDEYHPDVAFRIWTACTMERLMQAQLGIPTDTAMKIMPREKWMNLTKDKSVELKRGGYHLTPDNNGRGAAQPLETSAFEP